MMFVSYYAGDELRAAIAADGRLIDAAHLGAPSANLRVLIAAGPAVTERLLAAAPAALAGGSAVALASVRLGPPIPDPDKILCLGLNYKDHAAEAGLALPAAPVVFPKFRNSLIGAHDDIIVPRVATAKTDYEVELALVIGKRARDVSAPDALSYVFGYSAFNDVSARDLQMQTSQWMPGKAIDTFAPMGPGIVPAAHIGDPQNLMLSTRVNGVTLQHASTREMIFNVVETIVFLTSFMTLEPGDVIATGTPAGVGFTRNPPVKLNDGDVVEVEIERIGTLRNRVIYQR
jgi:2-keto-4-pentenoate hydratase/2-oxohepta-3-ene-1,7-dioic acid hydratase in catechol pathway